MTVIGVAVVVAAVDIGTTRMGEEGADLGR